MDTQNLHVQAEHLREQEKYSEALQLYDKVIEKYRANDDYAGMIEARGGKMLTYKHLFLTTGKRDYLEKAESVTREALEMAETHHLTEKKFRCHFHHGEIAVLLKEYARAVDQYQKSIDSFAGPDNAEKGDILYHLGVAQYKAGEKSLGKASLLAGIALIQQYESETDPFLFHVWLSGGYLSLATLLASDAPDEARKYLALAEKIIRSDDRLIIRLRQLSEISQQPPNLTTLAHSLCEDFTPPNQLGNDPAH